MPGKRTVARNNSMIEEIKETKTSEDLDDYGDESSNNQGEDFDENDLDSDFEEQLDAARARKRKRREMANAVEARRIISTQFLPSNTKKLAACLSCRLVLNKEKWRKLDMCPNCPQSQGLKSTTDSFSNLIGSVYPKASWVAQWQGMKNLIPGFYAMSVQDNRMEVEE